MKAGDIVVNLFRAIKVLEYLNDKTVPYTPTKLELILWARELRN